MGKVIFYKETEDPNKAKITLIHGQPDKLSVEEKSSGIELDINRMPPKDKVKLADGYKAISYINPNTKEITYEYVKSDRKLGLESLEARIKKLEDTVLGGK